MAITAQIIADSISYEKKRLTTLQLCYPSFIHTEFMAHRDFSRNVSSLKEITTRKFIEEVRRDPAHPLHWGKNESGMQSKTVLGNDEKTVVKELWFYAARKACAIAESMADEGVHEQTVYRILEPFSYVNLLVTSTDWANFYEICGHKDAAPEIRILTEAIRMTINSSVPVALDSNQWHLPYIRHEDRERNHTTDQLIKISVARCSRVSYLTDDGKISEISKDFELYNNLLDRRFIDAGPTEHQAKPDFYVTSDKNKGKRWANKNFHGNYSGWMQHKKMIEKGFNLSV